MRRSFPRATVIGWVAGTDGSLHLNSRDNAVVQPGSELIFVARGVDDTLTCLQEPYEVRVVSSSKHGVPSCMAGRAMQASGTAQPCRHTTAHAWHSFRGLSSVVANCHALYCRCHYNHLYLQVSPGRLGRWRAGGLPARNITCLCFDASAAPSVINSMAEFSGNGSQITLVAR